MKGKRWHKMHKQKNIEKTDLVYKDVVVNPCHGFVKCRLHDMAAQS